MEWKQSTLVKLGGSLLRLPDLKVRLERNLPRLDGGLILMTGGGEAADVVRGWDARFCLATEDAHELALQTLHLTAALLVRLLPQSRLISSRSHVTSSYSYPNELAWNVLDPPDILSEIEHAGAPPLPVGWHVTSDSIAAWVARIWRVGTLVLVKSVDLPTEFGLDDAAEHGFVDSAFPRMIREIPREQNLRVLWCNGRKDVWQPHIWNVG